MFKKVLICAGLSMALATPALAATYYVVAPKPGPAKPAKLISVTLGAYTPPAAVVGMAYVFDLKPLLTVSGDDAYTGAGVSWSVVGSTLPAGLTLLTDGTIAGTPTAAGTGMVTVRASYKTGNGEQSYQVVSLALTVSLAPATLPAGRVGKDYAAYDFKPLLTVTGDPDYSVSNVSFKATGVPEGMKLSQDGVLDGKPTAKNTSGANIQVVASYKTKEGQNAYTLVVNGELLEVTQIAAGSSHTCAVTTAGGAKCWGYNGYGQLGNNSTTQSLIPVDVYGLTSGVTSISLGGAHTCALTAAGGVKCWGAGTSGQLGQNSTDSSTVPVDVYGLTSGVTSISTGNNHTCALTAAEGAKCWGYNGYGQLGNSTATTKSPIPVDVDGLTSGVKSISAGNSHTCVVTTVGGAKCWGAGALGRLGNNATTDSAVPVNVYGLTSGVTSISGGATHTCAVTTSGGAKCWGYNGYGQLGTNATTDSKVPVNVYGLTSGVTSISAGNSYTCAVTAGGAKCWGYNVYGQLGNNSTTDSKVPVDVYGLTSGVTSISSGGGSHTCVVTTAGGAKCWGQNGYGQIGNSTTTTKSPIPVDVEK